MVLGIALLSGCTDRRGSLAVTVDASGDERTERRSAKPQGGAFVHLFEWTWSDIAHECERFLGPKGFAAVQVSPPSEHAILDGYPWWQRYQTVGYDIGRSRSGTQSEFASMVSTCAAAGVDVYVDAVINHMTAQLRGTGSNGTSYQKYEYPGLYMPANFHTPPCAIADVDYRVSAANVQNCELLGLADLNTGAEDVRSRIATYLIDLVRIGVRGFRVDAAKHISPHDLDAILALVATSVGPGNVPYYFLEVIDGGGEAIHASDFLDLGRASGATVDITDFQYGNLVGSAFVGARSLATLRDLGSQGVALLPSDRAVVFIDNHDTQRSSAISYQDAPYYDLATVFMLAWPYGYPSIMSSFAFDRSTQTGRDMGPPSDAEGHTTRVYQDPAEAPKCAPFGAATVGSWVCEHRAHSAVNMVAFRRATSGAPTVSDWWDNGSNQVAFGRGDRGFVIINRETVMLHRRFQTSMLQGVYCDVVAGDPTVDGCTGPVVTVEASGEAEVAVDPNSALAIHVNAKID